MGRHQFCRDADQRRHRFLAHMMLDTLGIGFSHSLRNPDRAQESINNAVSLPRSIRHGMSVGGQKQRAIGPVLDKPLGAQPRNGLCRRRVRHANLAREIGKTCFACCGDQISDQFHIIFHRLGLARGTRLAKRFGPACWRYVRRVVINLGVWRNVSGQRHHQSRVGHHGLGKGRQADSKYSANCDQEKSDCPASGSPR